MSKHGLRDRYLFGILQGGVWSESGVDMGTTIKPRGKVFRDPVHGLIHIEPDDAFLLELIDTRVFQRLRRIRQLGVSSLTYHGAEHSRFSHSMGVLNFAQRILNALRRRYKSGDDSVREYLDRHSKVLKAAALLHDIGHGPFSHLMERLFKRGSNHEDKTVELILDPDGDIAGILNSAGVAPEDVTEIIEGTSPHRLIADIVSSQLDADRMDYLLRDSLHTGVEYGRYDSEWIIRNLCIGRDPGSIGETPDESIARHRLCLDRDRGLHSAEQLILARLRMSMQVYMHRVTRGYEVLLLNLFRLAAERAKEDSLPTGTPNVVQAFFESGGTLDSQQWIQFDETAMFAAIAAWANTEGKSNDDMRRLAGAFLHRENIYLSRPVDKNVKRLTETMSLSREFEKVGEQGIDWELDENPVVPYKGLLSTSTNQRRDLEELSAESILLSTGDTADQAVPGERNSQILRFSECLISISRMFAESTTGETRKNSLKRCLISTAFRMLDGWRMIYEQPC